MKLKFDPSLDFQRDAINAVLGVFNGQPIAQTDFELSYANGTGGFLQTELGVGNNITLPEDEIFANVQGIQEANDIEKRNCDCAPLHRLVRPVLWVAPSARRGRRRGPRPARCA